MLLIDCENQAKTVIFWKVPAAKRFLLRRVLTLVYSYTCMCVKNCTRQMRRRMPGGLCLRPGLVRRRADH